jgi:hypothetical protein
MNSSGNASVQHRRAFGRRRGLTRQRGAAAVELAICATLLVPLTCLIIDQGYAWNRYQAVQTAARLGARAGAVACLDEGVGNCVTGNRPDDDYRILTAIRGALRRTSFEELETVIVYRIPATSGATTGPPGDCALGLAVPDVCNVYTKLDFPPYRPASDFDCNDAGTSPARFWKACTRMRTRFDADYVGVQVRVRHQNIIGIMGAERTMSDVSVFRLEPRSFVNERVRTTVPPPTTSASTIVATVPTSTIAPASTTTEATTTTAEPPTTPAPTTTVVTPTTGPPTTPPPTTAPPTTSGTTTTVYVPPATTTTAPPPPTTRPRAGGF